MMRYKKETVNGVVVETMANWNPPTTLSAVDEEKPVLKVRSVSSAGGGGGGGQPTR